MKYTREIVEEEAAESLEKARETFDEFIEVEPKTRTYAKADVRVDDSPDECPVCHKKGEQRELDCDYLTTSGARLLRRVFRCPSKSCDTPYFAVYEPHPQHDDVFFLSRCEPLTSDPYAASDAIKGVSPEFGNIATEAKIAEEMGLLQICGPGYRKALEFLVKDYIMSCDGSNADEIKKKQLGPCIKEHIASERVKQMASRAAWLGNDETHYERRWIDKDLTHLKALINLTVRFIESELEAERFIAEMPEGVK